MVESNSQKYSKNVRKWSRTFLRVGAILGLKLFRRREVLPHRLEGLLKGEECIHFYRVQWQGNEVAQKLVKIVVDGDYSSVWLEEQPDATRIII